MNVFSKEFCCIVFGWRVLQRMPGYALGLFPLHVSKKQRGVGMRRIALRCCDCAQFPVYGLVEL